VSERSGTRRASRLAGTARRLNRSPMLLNAARRTREWALGEQRIDYGLSSVRGRPVDVAFRQLAALRPEEPGVAGELGAAVLQGWQRLAEAQGRGRGEVDVAILFTDLGPRVGAHAAGARSRLGERHKAAISRARGASRPCCTRCWPHLKRTWRSTAREERRPLSHSLRAEFRSRDLLPYQALLSTRQEVNGATSEG
jgi:hypothetical protein